MEGANQSTSETAEVADEAKENQPENEKISEANSTTEDQTENENRSLEASTSGGSGAVVTESKVPLKRNYRRRTESGGESSSDAEMEQAAEAVEDTAENNEAADASESEDVSLDELRAGRSDDENIQSPRSTDSDDTDSSFSFGSPLSPLLRFGLGNRRMFDDDTDSNASESESEEVLNKTIRRTHEIMSKEAPKDNTTPWPLILLNRESGFFCKQKELRYANHRKVFERNFYGPLNSVQRLELMAKLNEHFGCVNCLGFSKNGRYLLSGSDDLRVILWDWYNNKPLTMANSKHRKNIFQCKFYDEGASVMKVVSASADGSISLHQYMSDGGHTEKQIYTHAGAVHKLAVTENVVYTCGEDGLIIEFDFRTKTPTKMITVREKHRKIPLFSISAHPHEMKYAVSGRDQFVRVYDRRHQKTVLARHCPVELLEKSTCVRYISCCTYNYNGTELIGSFNDENIYLFDTNNHSLGSYLHKYQGHYNSATIKGVNFYGPRSEFIVSGSDCSNIFFWDKQTEAIVQWMPGDENGIVNVLEPHPIYPVLATSGLDKDIKIWIASNEDFEMKKEDLEKCVRDNIRNQIEAGQSATFSLDPAIIQLARRFFQRREGRESTSPNPLAYVYRSSDEESSSP